VASLRYQVAQAVNGLTAVLAPTLAEIALGAGCGTPTVAFRSKAEHDKLTERQPGLIVVSEPEKVSELLFGNRACVLYPILVVLVRQRSLRAAAARYEDDVREAVRKTLYVPTLAGVAGVWNVKYDPAPTFDRTSWGNIYDVSGQRFSYVSDERRAT
jgi:hypothetical protein